MKIKARLVGCEQRLRGWEQKRPGRLWKSYLLCYTACFAAVAFVALLVYPLNGRSLVWSVDGLEQYYPFFVYEGQWIREALGSLLSGQGLQVTLWEWSLGYGSDVLSVLDVFFDPLNLTSALVPEAYSEYLFQFLVVLRLYLAGIAFSLYARCRGIGRFPMLCGALVYSLCGTALGALLWPGGANALILFPLLLTGVEKVFKGERPYLYIVAVALFFAISYYFSYMACLFLLGYCCLRVFQVEQRVTPARFLRWAGIFLGYLVIGALLACVALLPGLLTLFGLDRVTDSEVGVAALYGLDYYQRLFSGFVATAEVGSDCYIGFGGIGLVGVLVLFAQRGRHRALKVVFVVLTLLLLVPLAGSVLNGFNYATNRWAFVYSLCVAYIVAKVVPRLFVLGKRERRVLVVGLAVYALAMFLLPSARTEARLAALALTFVLMAVLLFAGSAGRGGFSVRWQRWALVGCIGAGIVCNVFYFVSPDEGGKGSEASPLGSMYVKLTGDSPNNVVASIEDETLWRYDANPAGPEANGGSYVRVRNDSLVRGINGIDFYNSAYNNDIDRFHTEMGLADTNINFSYTCLGGRSILEAVAGVKYYLNPDSPEDTPAYNYDDAGKVAATGTARGGSYTVYEAENYLPIGYTYDAVISRSTYEALSPAQRQEALLAGAVVDDEVAAESALPQASLQLQSGSVSYSVAAANGLALEDGVIKVTSPNATLTLNVEGLPDCETYVYFKGLDYRSRSPRESVSEESWQAMKWYQQANTLKKSMEYRSPKSYVIYAGANNGAGHRKITNFTSRYHLYGGKDTWLLNLGYAAAAQSTVTLTFSQKGLYIFDDLQIVCQPMSGFGGAVDKLKEDVLENVEVGTNRLSGTVSLDEAKMLFLSIPYSEGWTAYVDGQQVDIAKANTAFMVLELGPGEHAIELEYLTPGLVLGARLSLGGLVLLLLCVAFYELRVRKRRHALMVLGSMDEFCGLVDAANARGMRTVVCDGYACGPARAHASEGHVADVRDTQALARVYRESGADGVVSSFSDLLFECLVRLQEEVGAQPYCPPESMPLLRRKDLMKKMFEELGVPHAASRVVRAGFDDAELAGLTFPCVVKPLDGYGSRGVFVVRGVDEVRDCLAEAASYAASAAGAAGAAVVVEEYDDGHEFNMMTWVAEGVVCTLSVADREKSAGAPGEVPRVSRIAYPSRFTAEVEPQARAVLQRVADRLGLVDGPLCMQFFWKPGAGVQVCEVAGRIFGYEHELLELCSGFSIEQALLDLAYDREALRRRVRAHELGSLRRPSCGLYFHARCGTVASLRPASLALDVLDDMKDVRLEDVLLYYREGEEVGHGVGQKPYVARIYLSANNRTALNRASAALFGAFRVDDAAGDNMVLTNCLPPDEVMDAVSNATTVTDDVSAGGEGLRGNASAPVGDVAGGEGGLR